MRDLQRFSPFAILLCQFAFLVTTFATPVNAARIVHARACAAHHVLGLNVFHHIAHRLARPHPVVADRRAGQYLANGKIADLSAAQLGA
jgi:hypothetical protein